jgi:signal peptidase I
LERALPARAFRDLLLFRPARNQAGRSVLKELSVQPDQAKKASLEISSWWGRALVGRRPQWTLARVATLVVVIFVLFKFVYIAIRIEGNSMAPTYQSGRPNLINKLAYRWHEPRRGDVVAVRAEGTYLVLLKRIVGLPGERIAIRQGRAIVNGQPLTEPYASGRDISTRNEILLGHDEYFVIGDNREVSIYFTVHRREILGKTVL